jgi:hypothetical protein
MSVTYEIHPAIGVARVGNSASVKGYFVGPEPAVTEKAYRDGETAPGIARTPARSTFRDANGALLRQAVRFRVFKVTTDAQGKVLKKEALAPETPIQWGVRLANRKAVAPRFDDPGTLRNGGDPACLIDSGLQRIATVGAPGQELAGQFRKQKVTLGNAWIEGGWLYLLGGHGNSGMRPKLGGESAPVAAGATKGASAKTGKEEPADLDYADNDDWYDDTSDGPIYAKVLADNGWQPVTPAWALVAPADFAPEIDSFVSLYDVARQAAIDMGAQSYPAPGATAFFKDVLPVLERVRRYRWVNGPSIRAETQDRHARWATPQSLQELADKDSEKGSRARKMMWAHLPVPPDLPDPLPTGYVLPAHDSRQVYMPRLYSQDGESKDGVLSLLPYQYLHILNWQGGRFDRDRPPEIEFACDAMDRIALEACSGGAFFPGIEAPRITRDPRIYAAPLRFRQKGDGDPNTAANADPAHPSPLTAASDFDGLVAGQVTEGLAIPWQADFYYCQQGRDAAWWPASRPDDVFHESHPPKVVVDSLSDWTVRWDDNVANARDMVSKWSRLGIVRKIQAVPGPDMPTDEFESRAYDVEISANGIKSYFYYGETDRRLSDSAKRTAHFPKPKATES